MALSYPHLNGDISLDKAQIIAHFIEVVLYGMESLLFVTAIYLWLGTERGLRWIAQLFAMLLMFLASTLHAGASLDRLLAAFVGPSSDPVAFFIELWHLSYRLKNLYLIVELVLLDIFIIYQCYMVWDRSRHVIILPSFTLLCYLGCAICCVRELFRGTHPAGHIPWTFQKWMLSVLGITIFIKLICLGTMMKGSYVDRADSDWQISYIIAKGYDRFMTNLLIGIQCGGLVMLVLVITVPVYFMGSNVQDILLDLLSPLTGLSFFLILMCSFVGCIPSGGRPSRRSKFDGLLENHRRLPPIAISVDIVDYQSEPSEPSGSPIEAAKFEGATEQII